MVVQELSKHLNVCFFFILFASGNTKDKRKKDGVQEESTKGWSYSWHLAVRASHCKHYQYGSSDFQHISEHKH